MKQCSVKEYRTLKTPTEDLALSGRKRIILALHTLGYENVTMPLHILRSLYPLCRDADFDITV